MGQTIKEIREKLHQSVVTEQELKELAADERKGVQHLLQQYYRRQEKLAAEKARYQRMWHYENELREKGYKLIAGIDEVGRGPLAGPVVAAAVILPENVALDGLNDSKQLSLAKRESLFLEIQETALAIGIGVVSPETIDRLNIYQATLLAMEQALQKLTPQPDFVLIDAMTVKNSSLPQKSLIKGDAKSVSIAAASVMAKVTRDRMMADYDQTFPGYGFAKNAGYGTAEHLAGLADNGVTAIHRKSFSPVKEMLQQSQ
ncbi:ribonuclease HII [Vagococcus elongatus]|uniref:ribonuclease HII n=1 Tax=Vagococcus elongatus TaxID=180344 RepID=UPI001FE72356|nr:ribonuclease HII [Vagococcus elongatus]